ncbi:MAG: cob(I)yrinic acid a,c-diamide adenosyltransferase [Flavobacteriales bacterium]|nr:cob(I)yrinic acid a,c-diamide adenosyltransferase [Flavobacteriales bacterium]
MKIYTKTGDRGETSLLGGTRVPKYNPRIEAYGTIDELNAHIGLLRGQLGADQNALIEQIQSDLFTIGSLLAATPKALKQMKLPELKLERITALEQAIDSMTEQLPELRSFILPGSTNLNAACHVARCVCRRAERRVVELRDHEAEEIDLDLVTYLNRLSDYLFVLARKISADAGVADIEWHG